MSSQGRGSAIVAIAVALVCLSLLFNFEVVQARKSYKTYIVGGAQGWTFGIFNWPRKMRFRAGDTLVFIYPVGVHNVVVVNKAQYRSCNAPPNAPRYSTGIDRIKLRKGHNYFMCGYPGHCSGGNMRIGVKAM